MAHYIIHVIAFQLAFLLIYDMFLSRETFFNWNRVYLIASALLSVCIPFIKIDNFKDVVPQEFVVNLPEVIIGNVTSENNKTQSWEGLIAESKPFFTWETLLYLGMALAAILLIFKTAKLIRLLSKSPKSKTENLVIVKLINSTAAFSFFHYIFLGDLLNDTDREAILKHELIHVKQKHTLDLLFFEVLRMLFWFNPLVYMYQNRMMSLHEFIADAEVVKHQDKTSYYQNLLTQVFETKNISFINPFFKQSLIKKRIVMLTKSKSKQVNLLKYALLIPMVIGMLVFTSSNAQDISKKIDLSQFNYTVKVDEQNSFIKEKFEKYNTFLEDNPEYVGWAIYDEKKKEASYSIHDKSETPPEGSEKSEIIYKDGRKSVGYNHFINDPEAKNKREAELRILKEKYKDSLEVPFSVVDQVPIFPGCEDLSNDEQRNCMSKNISMHVNKNFNTNLANSLGLVGRQRINVIFKIDNEGNITDVRSRAPHPVLEAEAIRVINTLPKMIPGKQKGKAVTVPYSLPIVFQVQDENKVDTVLLNEVNVSDSDVEVPFAVIEQVPVYPGCESLTTNDEKKACMSRSIQDFVDKNFNTKIGKENGLAGRQRINVIFKIDTEGNIVGVRSRAPHPALEAEAIRVINSLPKMIPGKQKGIAVIVPYTLPIVFQVTEKND